MKMQRTECSETSAYKIQAPGNYPEEGIQHSEHGGSLKSWINLAQEGDKWRTLVNKVMNFWVQQNDSNNWGTSFQAISSNKLGAGSAYVVFVANNLKLSHCRHVSNF